MAGEIPRTGEALIRDIVRRLAWLERNPRPLRTHDWVIDERTDGTLVARHVPTGTETVIASPPP